MKIIITLCVLGLFLFVSSRAFAGKAEQSTADNAYAFDFTTIDGKPMPLADFKGKVLLIVNTASQCGLTPQYEGLEKLYRTYKDKGLVVIGVPSSDFGNQEPGSAAEIVSFTKTSYDVTFPLTSKSIVSGDDAIPFYVWAGQQKAGGFFTSKPRWNFHKYLVDRDGALIGSFASWTKPEDGDLKAAIEKALQ